MSSLITSYISFEKGASKRLFLVGLSLLLITFGTPSSSAVCSAIAATFGFAIFFLQILSFSAKSRFFAGFSFFFAVQAVQLYWLTSHPFLYIWAVYLLICSLFGVQFGLVSLLCTKERLLSRSQFLLLPAAWTLLEWSRLFWFSGFYFDLVGLSMTANQASLQNASYVGVLGLSFWVMLTNATFARGWLKRSFFLPVTLALLPYLIGFWHITSHRAEQKLIDQTHPPIQSLIIHAKKSPMELRQEADSVDNPLRVAFLRWKEIIQALAAYQQEKPTLIVAPEGAIPFSSKSMIFPKLEIQALFTEHLGVTPFFGDDLVTSEEIAQAIGNTFNCPFIIGLEGTERLPGETKKRYFNSAFFFSKERLPQRYDKQILVPMGEYIPFEWAKALAAPYGIFDSFTPGKEAVLFENGSHKIGTSVCYEETFGDLMRKNSQLGATLLVNVTDDYWFPDSSLGLEHFYHALARTVENGTPLIRSCNFGISGAIDSLGKIIEMREGTPTHTTFLVSVSSYSYPTLYSRFGDLPILLLSALIIAYVCFSKYIYKN